MQITYSFFLTSAIEKYAIFNQKVIATQLIDKRQI